MCFSIPVFILHGVLVFLLCLQLHFKCIVCCSSYYMNQWCHITQQHVLYNMNFYAILVTWL